MAKQYKALILESPIRPEYLARLEKIKAEPIVRVGSISDFKTRYGLK
ncbi:MAG: DUF2683 family protein [Nitrososphaerota archaeon]|jgi:hypothetical protein|nr:DUF2683 family protein [Nitrososphaerota archaeon]MDG6916341.1 DUF2683 family protein [Nitrososphaerota archaeon]MDG6947522.1 DUF2683 family protein [Nitrososphaerota archaeon]